jgi:hypothetical protein
VPEGVVVELEAVEVVHHDHARVGAARGRDSLGEVLGEHAPIPEPSELVGDGVNAALALAAQAAAKGQDDPDHRDHERREG